MLDDVNYWVKLMNKIIDMIKSAKQSFRLLGYTFHDVSVLFCVLTGVDM